MFDFRLLADGVPIKQDEGEGWTGFDIAHILPQVCLSQQQCPDCCISARASKPVSSPLTQNTPISDSAGCMQHI